MLRLAFDGQTYVAKKQSEENTSKCQTNLKRLYTNPISLHVIFIRIYDLFYYLLAIKVFGNKQKC